MSTNDKAAEHPPLATRDDRAASLAEFAREKQLTNDNYGGIKGAAGQYPPNDPTVPFRKVGELLHGHGHGHGHHHQQDGADGGKASAGEAGEGQHDQRVQWKKDRHPSDGDRGWTGSGYQYEVSKGDADEHTVV